MAKAKQKRRAARRPKKPCIPVRVFAVDNGNNDFLGEFFYTRVPCVGENVMAGAHGGVVTEVHHGSVDDMISIRQLY